MFFVYIDVPYDYYYDWSLGDRSEKVLSNKYGAKVKFFRNSLAGLTLGDCFKVYFDHPLDSTAFLLKTGFTVVSNDEVTKYLASNHNF